jgi:hypothetical protein
VSPNAAIFEWKHAEDCKFKEPFVTVSLFCTLDIQNEPLQESQFLTKVELSVVSQL